MQTVAEFATACETLVGDEIYILFEDVISQELRDAIYCWSETDSSEPARSAFNEIGVAFNIQSLIDY